MFNELLWLGLVALICAITILIFWRQDRREERKK